MTDALSYTTDGQTFGRSEPATTQDTSFRPDNDVTQGPEITTDPEPDIVDTGVTEQPAPDYTPPGGGGQGPTDSTDPEPAQVQTKTLITVSNGIIAAFVIGTAYFVFMKK